MSADQRMLNGKASSMRAMLVSIPVLTALFGHAAHAESVTEVPAAEVPNRLEAIAAASEANFAKIRTWSGTAEITWSSDQPQKGDGDRRDASVAVPPDITEDGKRRRGVAFTFDVANGRRYTSARGYVRVELDHAQVGRELKVVAYAPSSSRHVLTPEQLLYSREVGRPVTSSRPGFVESYQAIVAPPGHARSLGGLGGNLFDPAELFGLPASQIPPWEWPRMYARHLDRNHFVKRSEAEQKETTTVAFLDDLGEDDMEARRFRLVVITRAPGAAPGSGRREESVFSSRCAYHLVSWRLMRDGVLHHAFETDYAEREGIYLPSRIREWVYDEAGLLTRERDVTVKSTILNGEVDETLFTIAALELLNGDRVTNRIDGTQHIYQDGALKQLDAE